MVKNKCTWFGVGPNGGLSPGQWSLFLLFTSSLKRVINLHIF